MLKSLRLCTLAACLSLSLTGTAQARKIHDSWPVVAQERNEAAQCDIGVIGNGKFFLVVATGLPASSNAYFESTNGDVPGIVNPLGPRSEHTVRSEYLPRWSYRLRSEYSRRYPFSNGEIRTIDKTVKTDADGKWRGYLLPFVSDRESGVVTVAITAGNCHVETSFPWRRGIRTIK